MLSAASTRSAEVLNLFHSTQRLSPNTQDPTPKTQDPTPNTQDPRPTTHHPKPTTQNPSPNTHNPKPNTHHKSLALLAVLLLATLLAIPSLNKAGLYWEWLNLSAADSILRYGVPIVPELAGRPLLIHPPSEAYLLALCRTILGPDFWSVRLSGLLAFLLIGVLLYTLALRLGYGHERAVGAAAIYVTNPFALQGALSVDFSDGSLAVLACVWFLLLVAAGRRPSRLSRSVMAGLALACAFLTKIATALILLAALAGSLFLHSSEKKDWLRFAAIAFGGMAAAALLWFLYCLYLSIELYGTTQTVWELFRTPIEYLAGGSAAVPVWRAGFRQVLLHETRFVLYAGPVLVLIGLLEVASWARKRLAGEEAAYGSAIPLFVLGVFVGYCVVLGGTGPFPKYFLPAMPFVALFAAAQLIREVPDLLMRRSWKIGLAALGLVAYYVLMVGDPMRILNYDLRWAVMAGDPNPVLTRFLVVEILYLLPFLLGSFVAVLVSRFPNVTSAAGGSDKSKSANNGGAHATAFWRPWVALCLITSQVSICLIQGKADYSVRYNYGTPFEDLDEISSIIQDLPGDRTFLGDQMFAYATDAESVPGNHSRVWNSMEWLREVIERDVPSVIIYGLPINTIDQVRTIARDETLQSLLVRRYNLSRVGQFWVWTKKPDPERAAWSGTSELGRTILVNYA